MGTVEDNDDFFTPCALSHLVIGPRYSTLYEQLALHERVCDHRLSDGEIGSKGKELGIKKEAK